MKSSNIKIILVVIILGAIGLLAITNLKLGSQSIKQNPVKDVQNVSSVTQKTGLNVGDTFPDFSVTDVDGKTITNNSLRGKPTIVWFTASWCVPCQIGAKKVSQLKNDLGGNAFNVLVVFVDPREQNSDLVNWKKQFASSDWIVGFDNKTTPLAQKVNLKFLDSKFILDKNGVIKNIDFKQADENYLNTIKQVVKEN